MLLVGCVGGSAGGGDASRPRARDAALTDMGGALCRLNSDCPPGLYCKARRCTFDCRVERDCERGLVCESGECVEPLDAGSPPDAGPQVDAWIPDARADLAALDPDAAQLDPDAARADPDANRPAPDAAPDPDAAVAPRALGEVCERAADCESDICLEVAVNRQPHVVCASLCCSENDCPLGFGCLYFQGARFCMPADIYPPGFDFTASAGQ